MTKEKSTKDKVISILANSEGYVSGEEISRQLGISRAAVNTAVKAARRDGYTIESATRRGYIMNSAPGLLNAGELMAALGPSRMESVLCLGETDSTNARLRAMAEEGAPHGQIVIADSQSEGRGRRGRTFLSPGNTGIYMSILLRPGCAPTDTMHITACTAVAVAEAIEKQCGVNPYIKWVNDLILENKKVCGILTEMAVEGESGHIQYIIIGIGINVNGAPEELKEMASSIAENIESGEEEFGRKTPQINRAELAAEVINSLDEMAETWQDNQEKYLRAYRERCITVGKDVRLIAGRKEEEGFALGVNDDFSLRVKLKDGTIKNVNYGEISVRGMYDYI